MCSNICEYDMNKKIKGLAWQDDELRIIAANASKLHIDEIITLVNKVSQVIRTERDIRKKGNLHGFKFKVAA